MNRIEKKSKWKVSYRKIAAAESSQMWAVSLLSATEANKPFFPLSFNTIRHFYLCIRKIKVISASVIAKIQSAIPTRYWRKQKPFPYLYIEENRNSHSDHCLRESKMSYSSLCLRERELNRPFFPSSKRELRHQSFLPLSQREQNEPSLPTI